MMLFGLLLWILLYFAGLTAVYLVGSGRRLFVVGKWVDLAFSRIV